MENLKSQFGKNIDFFSLLLQVLVARLLHGLGDHPEHTRGCHQGHLYQVVHHEV